MTVITYENEAPETFDKSIFLAGPSPREASVQSWRPEALRILKDLGYNGVVYVPEFSTRPDSGFDYSGVID